MNSKLKPRVLAWMLLFLLGASACALWQQDPIAASLFAMKSTYEASVQTAGQAYINNAIDINQLNSFTKEARKFYSAYTVVLAAYEAGTVKTGDPRLDQLRSALDALEVMVTQLILKKTANGGKPDGSCANCRDRDTGGERNLALVDGNEQQDRNHQGRLAHTQP